MEILDDDSDQGIVGPFASGGLSIRGKISPPKQPGPNTTAIEEGYNLELVTGRPAAPHFHSWTHYSWQAQEMWSDLYVQIHPKTAKDLKIEDGNLVLVESRHGAIRARAWLYNGVRPTSVFIPIGWGERQPFSQWYSVNFLTDKKQRDPVSEQTNLKSLLCRIKPI